MKTIFGKQFLGWANAAGFHHIAELSTADLEAFVSILLAHKSVITEQQLFLRTPRLMIGVGHARDNNPVWIRWLDRGSEIAS